MVINWMGSIILLTCFVRFDIVFKKFKHATTFRTLDLVMQLFSDFIMTKKRTSVQNLLGEAAVD